MEKVVAGRPLQRRRHRRRRRPGDGDGQAVPAAARALREGRGHVAQPGGQGQPAVDDGARQPARGDAGHGRRADLRRLRHRASAPAGCGTTTSPAAVTRSATTSPPARAACTPARSSRSASAPSCDRDDGGQARLPGAVGGGRRRLGHGRARRAARHLPGGRDDHRRRLAAGRRRRPRRASSRDIAVRGAGDR